MAKTQTEVLASLFTKLGYSNLGDIPPKSTLEEKLLSGELSVREAVVLDIYSRGIKLQEATKKNNIGKMVAEIFPAESKLFAADAPSPSSISSRATAVVNSTEKAGFTLDTPFKDISNDRAAMERIASVTKAIDPHWSGVFQSLKVAHTQATGDQPFIYQNPKDKAAGLAGAKQSRGTLKFEGVPPAQDAFPEIVSGLSQVEDTTTRNALVASSLAPYRPGEIANLRLGQYDMSTIEVDRPPGYFDIEKGAIVFPEGRTGNKAAQNLVLDKNSILYNTLAQQAREAEAVGSSELFPDMTTGKMTSAIQQHITPRMQQFEDIMGRPFNRAQDFRKLLASMIVGELGYTSEADKMMGHSTDAQINESLTKINSQHYVSTIIRNSNPLAAVQLSLENMIGEAIGAQTLNETAVSLGLNISGYTDENAQPVTITRSGEQLSEVTEVAPREMTSQELASLEARREEATANARLAAQQSEQQALTLEEENIKRRAEVEAAREAERERKAKINAETRKTPSLSDDSKRAFQDLGEFFKGFGKMAVGGLGVTAVVAASQEAYAEEMERSGSTPQALAAGAARGAYEVLEPLPFSFARPQPVGEGSDVVPTDEEGRPQYQFLDEMEAQQQGGSQASLDEQIGGLFEDDEDLNSTYPEGDK